MDTLTYRKQSSSRTATVVFVIILVLAPGHVTVAAADVLASHGAISILSDRDFTLGNGVVAGSGSQEDPYVIENWDIDASVSWVPVRFPGGTLRAGIHIANTAAHLVIRNVQVHDGGSGELGHPGNLGIAMSNATNVVVDSVKVWNGTAGVFLTATSNSTVVSGEFYNLRQGIVV